MKLRTKIAVDKFIGNTIIFVLGSIIKFIHLFYNTKLGQLKPVERIAVCKLLGMGSIIQSTPLIQSLRKNFPNAEIIFVTSIKNSSLIKIIKSIDKIYLIDDTNLFKLIKSIIYFKSKCFKRIDYYIDLEVHSNFSTILTFLSFARIKIGYYIKEEWFRVCLFTNLMYYNINAPLAKVYNQSLKLLYVDNFENELYNFATNIIDDKSVIINKLNGFNNDIKSDYIVINPNASDLRIERRWYYNNYVELINSILKENKSYNIVLTGSENESNYVKKIVSNINEKYKSKVIDTSGKLTVKELISLIRYCKLMITNDSGPMHIAFSLNKITIALFGPCSPQQYNTQNNVHFIYKNIYCSPCVHQFSISPCKGDNQCMQQIKLDEVITVVKNILLDGSNIDNFSLSNTIIYRHETNSPLGLLKKDSNN